MKRWLFKSLLLLAGLTGVMACVSLFLCWQYGIWSWHDWEVYKCMRHECHPVWRDLHARRIKAGDDIESIIWRTHPSSVEQFEDVKMLHYGGGFTGIMIVGKDGKAVSATAASCTWNRSFFQTWDDAESNAFWTRYSAHVNAKWHARQIEEVIAEIPLTPMILVLP